MRVDIEMLHISKIETNIGLTFDERVDGRTGVSGGRRAEVAPRHAALPALLGHVALLLWRLICTVFVSSVRKKTVHSNIFTIILKSTKYCEEKQRQFNCHAEHTETD